MSSFGKSFERELGKNTGKWVSNVIFGDGHSTPYRRAENRHRQKLKQQRIQENNFHKQKLTQIKLENGIREREQNLLIDSAVLQNVDIISSYKISNNIEQIVDLLLELSIQVKTNKWYINDEEGKIRNKYNEALLEKFNQTLLRLKTIDSNNSQIEYFEKNLKNFKNKRFLKKNESLLIFVSILFVAFCIFLFTEGLLMIVLIPIVFIIITMLSYRYYKRNRKSVNSKIQNNKYLEVKETKEIISEDETTIVQDNIIEESSFFFDLNENERIEKKLTTIWDKYRVEIDSNIINRKPIFSADGVDNSILFVGINPSYNISDDDVFIKSNDGSSLMYGSFYQLVDAPKYFQSLEFFADKLNKGYTHINLLYARENDRDLLLNVNHNFIREQLELTYETILKINPVAIIFFSDYCKDLIFGKDRWVDPNTELNESYILNGTKFPVFFTKDLTAMTAMEQIELISKIEKVI